MTMRMSRKTAIHTGIFVAVSLALLVVLLRQITLSDFKRLGSQLTLGRIALLSGLYVLMAVIRGVRLGYLLQERNYGQLTAITAIHAFLNHVLPFRLGELSLPFLIRGFTARGLAAGSLALVTVRLYDVVSTAFLSLFSLLIVHEELSAHASRLFAIFAGVVILFFALALTGLAPLVRITCTLAVALLRKAGKRGAAAADRLAEFSGAVCREVAALTRRQKYVLLPLSSLALTLVTYIFFYLTMVFMGINLGFFRNMLASLGELAASLLPNAIGSFGTLEAGWAAGYVLCGVSKSDAVATGFILHGIIVVSGAALSAWGALHLAAARARRRRDQSAR